MNLGIRRRELADFERGLWRLFFEIRVVGLSALGIIALLPLANVEPVIAAFVLGAAVPANIAMREFVARLRYIPWWIPIIDAALSSIAIVIQPELAPIVLIVLLGSTSQAATAGWRATILATALGAPFLFIATIRYGVSDGITQILAYLSVSFGVTVFIAVIADSERQARENREQLLAGIDAIVWEAHPYPFVDATVTGNTEEVLGLAPETLSGPAAWLSRIPAFDRAAVISQSQTAIRAGRDHELTYRITDADGSLRHVRDRVRVVVDADGSPTTARSEEHTSELQSH